MPLVVGGTLVLLAVVFFLNGLGSDRITFGFDAAELAGTWNDTAEGAGRPLLTMDEPAPRPDESGDLVFGHSWSGDFSLRGRIDPQSGHLIEISVIGDPAMTGGQLMIDAMDLLIWVTEPSLTAAERLSTLQELGVVGGDPIADLRATRGDTDYVVAGTETAVGMSAAPHS